MAKPCKVAGADVTLRWDQETALRYKFRMGELGGEPSIDDLRNRKKAATALFKVLWGLLPKSEHVKYQTPEDLFQSVNHEEESEGIFESIVEVYNERYPTTEKKSSGKKSHSQESNSESTKENG